MLLGIRFDAETMARAGGTWWADLISHVGVVPQIAIAAATAAALLGGRRLLDELRRAADAAGDHRLAAGSVIALIAGHALSLSLFFLLSCRLFEAVEPASTAIVLSWFAFGSIAVATLSAAAVPPSVVVPFLRATAKLLALAVLAGAGAWFAGYLTATTWTMLRDSTLHSVHAILSLLIDDAVVDPPASVVGTDRFWVVVAKECSGYQGIGMLWAFVGAYLWAFRDSLRFPRALVLLPIATAAAWIANVLRIAALVLVGTWGAPSIALGGFHSYVGSLLFCVLAVAIAYVGHRSAFLRRSDGLHALGSAESTDAPPTAAYLVPMLAIFAAAMLTGAASSGGFDHLYPLRVVVAGIFLLAYRRRYELRWSWSWPPIIAGLVVFVLWLALEPVAAHAQATARPAELDALPAVLGFAWIAFRVLGTVVTVPLAEELAFRGYLSRRLATVDFHRLPLGQITIVGLVASSILFGAMHERIVAGTIAGVVYGLVARQRGSLTDAVVAHATTNAVLAAYVMTTGTWSLWL